MGRMEPDDLAALAAAAIVSEERLAAELARLHLSDDPEHVAPDLRLVFLDAIVAARQERHLLAVVRERVVLRVMQELDYPRRLPTVRDVAEAYAAAVDVEPVAALPDRECTAAEVWEEAVRLHENMIAAYLIERG